MSSIGISELMIIGAVCVLVVIAVIVVVALIVVKGRSKNN
jgi:hypothetical protein